MGRTVSGVRFERDGAGVYRATVGGVPCAAGRLGRAWVFGYGHHPATFPAVSLGAALRDAVAYAKAAATPRRAPGAGA